MALASIEKRIAALAIDKLIVFTLLFVFVLTPFLLTVTFVVGPNHQILGDQLWYRALLLAAFAGLGPVYEIFFTGLFGATPGKMLLRLKVVMPGGERISFARAAGRGFAKILSGIILGIGFLVALGDPERRALHDMICGTRVVEK